MISGWDIGYVVLTLLFIWLFYEAWRTPTFRQDEDGNWIQTSPSKTLKDLFKRK